MLLWQNLKLRGKENDMSEPDKQDVDLIFSLTHEEVQMVLDYIKSLRSEDVN